VLKRNATVVAKVRHFDDLRLVLESRRAELAREVQGRIRDARSHAIGDRDVVDSAESSEVDIQDAIEFALIQLKAETLKRVNTALNRIDEGDYGVCFECGGEIAEARLRALPFAVRCRNCEEVREAADRRERSMAHRDSSPLFVDLGTEGQP
jgi:DnaK suppressor protein